MTSMTAFVISRVATQNDYINGRTLYLTNLGFWSLDIKHARRFGTKAEATLVYALDANPGECSVEEIGA